MSAWKADALPLGDARLFAHSTARTKSGQGDRKQIGHMPVKSQINRRNSLIVDLKQGNLKLIYLRRSLSDNQSF